MTNRQKIELRMSQVRSRLNEIAGLEGDALTDEVREESGTLQGEYGDLETRFQAAVTADGAFEDRARREFDDDSEAREFRALEGRARIGNYMSAALEMRAVAGAEGEFNAALKIGAGAFPMRLLAPPAEERATTGTDIATRPRRWIDRLFAGTAAASVGVTMESVEAGAASYPVTTGGADAAQRAKAQAAGDAAWSVGVTEIKPTRNSVRAVFTLEDAARIPGLEEALRRDLDMALTEGVDRAVFLGDAGATGTDADITGLVAAANVVEKTITQGNKIKGAGTLQAFAELIDGKAAMQPSDLRTVMAVGANTLWSHTLANTGAAVDTTIAEFLRRFGMSWLTRGDIETATAADDFGALVGLARGIEGAAVMAMWDSGQLIRDPYTKAGSGEVALTLSYLWGFALPRATNFARIKFVA